jgi:hypothetical protein
VRKGFTKEEAESVIFIVNVESIGIIHHTGYSLHLNHYEHGMPMREFPSSITDEIPT